ncbi:hypothetical protein AK812_SmicGene14975 [Symbiodinium microadriaticum]|uniref:Uncharacterized protein n=1 Tax=Symbiodinium microadriaticum TaxID=2951 RepID=A0A1Q9E486_SYMMI|nr:hypothetical protein AK812_SmicGene14975 [Symbiodinium microadriaticum]
MTSATFEGKGRQLDLFFKTHPTSPTSPSPTEVLLAVLCSATGASTFLGPSRARSAFRIARQAAPASVGKPVRDDEDMLYSEEDEYGDEFDEEEGDYMELDGPPPEVLDGWEKDEMAMALLANFQSEEFEGKKVMSFRDVAMLLEVLGLEREQFVAIFSGQGGMEDEFDDDFLDEEEEMMLKKQFERGYGGGGPGGGSRGRGGGGVSSDTALALACAAGVAEDGKITEAEAAEAAVEDVVEADDPERPKEAEILENITRRGQAVRGFLAPISWDSHRDGHRKRRTTSAVRDNLLEMTSRLAMDPVIIDAADGAASMRRKEQWYTENDFGVDWENVEKKLTQWTPWSLMWASDDEWHLLRNPIYRVAHALVSHCRSPRCGVRVKTFQATAFDV